VERTLTRTRREDARQDFSRRGVPFEVEENSALMCPGDRYGEMIWLMPRGRGR